MMEVQAFLILQSLCYLASRLARARLSGRDVTSLDMRIRANKVCDLELTFY